WPFHSRVGAWDHPRWGLKRFADDHVRAVEQYRRAYLLEAQLGWWVILGPSRDWDAERPDEIEYLCTKALAHDAPLSFQSVTATGRPANARQDELLTTIGRYERLRLANYFNEDVKERLKAERQEYRLEQADDGLWQFRPVGYLEHKVTGLEDGSNTWTVTNRFGPQPLELRIQALYAAYPYDDTESLVLAEFTQPDEFQPAGAAGGVRGRLEPVRFDREGESVTEPSGRLQRKPGRTERPENAAHHELRPPALPSGAHFRSLARFTATNTGASPVGAWVRAVKGFEPSIDLRRYDALGLWVYGDGGGELLNLQLTNRPEYFRTVDDHYIKVNFSGWRYFELLFRERDAAAYHDYQWPYGAHTPLHRSPLVRHVVNKLTIYMNNLPPGKDATCYLAPIKALRVRKVVLRNPTIDLNGRRLVFPVELESGMAIELNAAGDCRLYDERGELVAWVKPQGERPKLRPGRNTVRFTCDGPEGFNSRAMVTVVASGEPIRGRNPEDQINWSLLKRQYESPRTILALDGRQNRWQIRCAPELGPARLEMELKVEQVGDALEAFQSPGAVTLDGFEQPPAGSSSSGDIRRKTDAGDAFPYDVRPTSSGCLKGITQQLALTGDVVKFGRTAARYTATSARNDRAGWSVKYRRLKKPLDVTRYAAIGFWLHGDGKGEAFKLQLRDAAGGWQDMVTRVDFTGWRYCQFALGAKTLKDPSRIVSVNIYYNGIPAKSTVTCYVDEIRLLPRPRPLRNPQLTIDGQKIRFPAELHAGDRLRLLPDGHCQLHCVSGARKIVRPDRRIPQLNPGTHTILLTFPQDAHRKLRAVVSLSQVCVE
ncbi:MAG: hypothetical protein GXP27_21530, partial [Planctomycetes bacterium]|nr:hypothetical protein [Planctomycetota bacterium]